MHAPQFLPHPRYEIVGLIGNGDFAAVYRARDLELGREVAIKQIHQQYLADPRRLERFWREAQLLAKLEHPHIMTIYDIVRSHGWLVLELMQGTVLDATRGQPIDLGLLRSVLIGSLQGLAMMHNSGTLHGDIKPTNLLVDKLGRIKLGDFGLARRVASDQGSYLKGATRYMAPEMVAPQFGPVGPTSDLYSLGFTAYELLCGTQQFELLFPGLEAFGRDRQVAWMMWHAAPDRRLPPVASVLGGVPEDIARVIDRLVQKEQTRRYPSAEHALAELAPSAEVAAKIGDPEAQKRAAEQKSARRRRLVAIGALAMSVLLSAAVLFIPTEGKPPPAPPPDKITRGVVRNVLAETQTLVIEDIETSQPREFQLAETDRVLLNDRPTVLRDLRELDQVTVTVKHDAAGGRAIEVLAARPEGDRGVVSQIALDVGELKLTLNDSSEELAVRVGAQCPIELNGEAQRGGRPLVLADLAAGDRVLVDHYRDDTGRHALSISALRVVPGEGVVRKIDLQKGLVTIAATADDAAATVALPLAGRCEVTLNGRRVIDSQELTPAELRPGDAIRYERDVELVSIAIQRQFQDGGPIAAINYDVRSLVAKTDLGDRTFVLTPDCQVLLGGEAVTLDDLRRGDRVEIAFDSPDAESPEAKRIVATRPPDPTKWAVVIAAASFDDSSVAAFPAAAAQADRLRKTLIDRYAVPPGQVIVLDSPSRVRLEQGLADAVGQSGQAEQLVVLLAGRVAVGSDGLPRVVPKDFAAARADDSGVALAPLLTQVENSPAKQKIVLLDLQGAGSASQSAASWFELVRGTRNKPLLKTTNVIAASGPPVTAASAPAALTSALAAAVGGAADLNRDNVCELTELHEYLLAAAKRGDVQATLYLPDNTPPRITDEAAEAIRRLAALMGQPRIEASEVQGAFLAAQALAPRQPEPRLASALVLLKARQHNEAITQLGELLAAHPSSLVGWEASAWAKFEKLNYTGGVADLAELVKRLPAGELSDSLRRAIPWVGRLREFAGAAVAPERRASGASLAALDAAVAKRGGEVARLYQEGRAATAAVIANFDRQAAAATPDEQAKLSLERRHLRHYASFSCETAVQEVLAGLGD
jgi:serine/threonine-protein kinase